jgi:periplasmic nitrate reductase NapE
MDPLIHPHIDARSCLHPHMQPTQRRELAIFGFLTLLLAPFLTVIMVAGYGFCVWMYQLLMGPPAG